MTPSNPGGLTPKIVRSLGAVIAGFVAASAVMMVVEMVNGHVLYPELGKMAEGVTDKEEIRALMASAPVGALRPDPRRAAHIGRDRQ